MRFSFLSLAIILLSSTFAVQAKMYKWTDEEGQTHFGDKIPQRYQTKAHDELNESGMQLKHLKAAKTAEEKAADSQRKKELEKIAYEEKKQKQLDRVLLDAYDSEHDLIAARDSRLDAVASQVQLSVNIINDSTKKIASMGKQVTQIKASNRKVPANLYKSIDTEKQQIVTQKKIMANHKKRSEEITVKYNSYIERFRAAKSQ
ncbi:hypothetical protein MNBD_GAMMA06-474 [hydrothermal vent metagenome]|uniref:DUF4124 domain-containing protein n=1 Tax=hydrothermal vent metagenome TaxID=652676 RepID=A0A3B0XEX2_9ZZZZ